MAATHARRVMRTAGLPMGASAIIRVVVILQTGSPRSKIFTICINRPMFGQNLLGLIFGIVTRWIETLTSNNAHGSFVLQPVPFYV